jgi:hypothetical protein
MYCIVPELPDVGKDLGPSRHLSEAPGHDSHETQLFATDLPACGVHYWLDVDVLRFGVPLCIRVNLVLIGELDKEAATMLELDSELKLVLAWRRVRLDLLKILRVKS